MNKIKKHILYFFLGLFILSSVALRSDFFEIAKQLELYTTMFKELNMYYIDEINPAELNEKAMKSMLESLDPYTRFYDEQGMEDLRIKRSGEYSGIGAYTRYTNHRLYILETYKEAPATRAGLQAGDEILQIDDVKIKDYKGEDISTLLRGTPGTEIQLKILRQGEEHTLNVTRSKVDLEPIPYYDMVDEEVGYVSFVTFNRKASTDVKKAMAELKEKGMKKLILDLRNNPGGLLNEAVAVANIFIPKNKVVVTTSSKVKKWSKSFKTLHQAIDLNIPVVILINSRSASASEIVAGSLQDYDRAVIMGERSFGKGLVQRFRDLGYGSQMKMTISKYYTPSGRCIQELDYTHRDSKTGEVPKFSDGKVAAFKTANGREVFDGGGIMPDIAIEKPETIELTKVLFQSDALFHFITRYYYANEEIAPAEKFQLDDSVFESFLDYLTENPEFFKTSSEKKFDKAMQSAKKEGYANALEEEYDLFAKKLVQEKITQLRKNKEEITERLTEDIIKRYYYRKGVYQQKLALDKTIVRAVKLLHDEEAYDETLR